MPESEEHALFCYNKARNKERKKGDALRKRFGDFRTRRLFQWLENGRYTKNNPCKLSRGAAIAIGDVVHKDHE